jgi:hypothetical protein
MGKRVYSDEFKWGAVEQVLVQRHTMSSVASRFGVNYQTARGRVQEVKAASVVPAVHADRPAFAAPSGTPRGDCGSTLAVWNERALPMVEVGMVGGVVSPRVACEQSPSMSTSKVCFVGRKGLADRGREFKRL